MFNVFFQFLVLGLYSFGGPAAHIGYFQREFVQNKQWLTDQDFSQAVALCQFLPGPASSQLGMYIGYKKAGYLGAFSAFVGFTLPSFLLLTLLAIGNQHFNGVTVIDTIIQAAKLLAVIVVADALWGMAKKNIINKLTFCVAFLTAISVFFSSGLIGQILPILMAASLGYLLSFISDEPSRAAHKTSIMFKPNLLLLAYFSLLLFMMPMLADKSPVLNLFNIFYQAGSFVFGGGHVVLPLLEPMLDGTVSSDTFLSAYAAAQLVPGPMFTMASYLGASALGEVPVLGSLIATVAVFLPGSLLLFTFLPAWQSLFANSRLNSAIALVNASVVGLLGSAFIKPVLMTSISSVFDVMVAALGYLLLKYRNCPVWMLIILLFIYKFFL